jgi:hypothetical protein
VIEEEERVGRGGGVCGWGGGRGRERKNKEIERKGEREARGKGKGRGANHCMYTSLSFWKPRITERPRCSWSNCLGFHILLETKSFRQNSDILFKP